MTRRRKDPLRPLTEGERRCLTRLRRSRSAPAAESTRAALLLLVSAGHDYQAAARAVGRRSGDAVAHLVARFNAEGTAALTPRHGGGRRPTYGPEARGRIAAEAARAPTPERDGTATWSLSSLRRILRAAPDGLPRVSTYTIRLVLQESGASYQRSRTWCPTGTALRRRKAGPATVTDPDAGAKKSRSRTPTGPARRWASRSGAPTKPAPTRRSPTRDSRGGPKADRCGCRTSICATARPRSSRCSTRPTGASACTA